MDKTSKRGGSRSGGLKHRLAQVLLRSSCSSTATSSDLVKLSISVNSPRQEPEFHPLCRFDNDRCRNRIAPVVQVSIDCGARHSIRAAEPLLPLAGRREGKKGKKKERRVTENGDLYETGGREGRMCPPASPSSPTRKFCYSHDEDRKQNKKAAHGRRRSRRRKEISSSSSFDCNNEIGLFSSGEEEEEEESGTLFSSKSFSSDSTEFYCSSRRRTRKKKESRGKPRRGSNELWPLSSISSMAKKAKAKTEMEKGGFAFVKNSSDPYMDFQSSMVEMIVERQMISSRDMENLLRSYLSLNSPLHHPVILEAFIDVWEAILG